MPLGTNHVLERETCQTTDGGLTYYCAIGKSLDYHLRSQIWLLKSIFSTPIFNYLRTEEQLAYYMDHGEWLMNDSVGWFLTIQSEHDPAYVEYRLEHLLGKLEELLRDMPEIDFTRHRDNLAATCRTVPRTLSERNQLFMRSIESNFLNFSASMCSSKSSGLR